MKRRKGQTAVEYLLVTLALTVAFSLVYKVLQFFVAREFKHGGMLIMRMYKEDPW